MAIDIDKFPDQPVANYQEVRKQLQNGDILLCAGSGVFSSMIQQATGSVWSHAAFILRLDAIDRVMLLESVEPIGVRTVRLAKYLEDYGNNGKPYPGGLVIIRNKNFGSPDVQGKLNKLTQFAIDQFGYPYDKEDIAKIAARIMASKIHFTTKQKKKIAPNREYICSEYVARCYEQVGLNVKWNEKGFIAPSDFAADQDFELLAVLNKKI